MASRIFLQLGIATIFFIVLIMQDASTLGANNSTGAAGTGTGTGGAGGSNSTGKSAAAITKCSFAMIVGALSLTALRL